ncbi:hypothetical protein E4T50_11144 [Aureobasidium sp. EXF-12298]|nr:hypothetical protein E4T50_11144 [Aureobasidium sp. EXF-12298]
MASQATTDDSSTKWAKHAWSPEAASAAIIKSKETVELISSEDQVVVLIHKELLCFFSSYYSAALKGKFLEAEKNQFEVDLDGDDLESFVTWIYTGKLAGDTQYCYVNLYVFADLVDIMALRRQVIGVLALGEPLRYELVKHIHVKLAHTSPLLKHALDFYIAHWGPSSDKDDPCLFDSDEDLDYLLANFIYQVMKGIAARDNAKDFYDRADCPCCSDVCQYHEHPSKEEWKATCGQLENSKMPTSLEESN